MDGSNVPEDSVPEAQRPSVAGAVTHVAQNTDEPAAPLPVEPAETLPEVQQPKESTSYGDNQEDMQSVDDVVEDDTVTWTASEFIAHNKSPIWYMQVAGVTVVVALVIFLLTHDKISTSVVVVAGIALGGYGARQPRLLTYALSRNGLMIANKYFPFNNFRSFSVVDEGNVGSIVFMPLKRFGQAITVYYDLADEEAVVGILENQLPLEKRSNDLLDNLMRKIRF